jgi:glycosyltransferase involved in cell wall biosynthesis/GT2 family glycosyltransferase
MIKPDASALATPPGFAPVRMVEVELAQPLPTIERGSGELGIPYRTAQILIRLHGEPLGFAVADLGDGAVEPAALAELIWEQLATPIAAHLEEDGLAVPAGIEANGLSDPGTPPCRRREAEFLREAPFVSVVIPTKDRPESAARTVKGIFASSYPRSRFEVIVVDNASGDDATFGPEDVEAPADARLRILREPNPGGSNARNRGLAEASGEIVVCADDDVDVDESWLARMVQPISVDERVSGVAGLTAPRELETPSQLWFEGFGGFMRGFERRVYDIAEPPPDKPLFPFTIGDLGSGQNMAFRRSVLLELGGFDPALGTATVALGGEDLDAMFRVLLAGNRVVYEPAAIVRHEHQRAYEQFQRRVWGYGVGLTSCLTKSMIENPRLLGPKLLRLLPAGVRYALSPRSAKNESKQEDYPSELTRLELRGMAYGPIAYLRSRRRHSGRRAAAPAAPRRDPATSLRVLIVTDSHPPLIGGANRSVELLSRHLVERGHAVTVATAWQAGLPAEEVSNGVHVHRIRDLASRARWISEDPYKHNPPPFPDPEAVAALRRLVRRTEPDLVHAYGWLAHSAAAALRRHQVPLLLSARDYGNVCAVRTLIREGDALCDGPAPRKCLSCARSTYGTPKGTVAAASVLAAPALLRRRVTAVHSVSHYVAEQMERFLRVDNAIERVIPNFHEDTGGAPVDEDAIARLPEQQFILFVGAFRRIKGIEELLAAYWKLEDPPPLVLVGTRAPDTPQPFPPQGVTVIEDVPHATVMAMWDRALFGVLPTKAPEALGNVVHEAMSKGRAMIGTRPGGQEDMIEDGASGLLVPGGDVDALAAAMARLIADPALRERFGERARQLAGAFTPEAVMPKLEELYGDTIAHFEKQLP